MLFKHTQNRNALTAAAFLATVWVVGAAWQPTSTYHLAPLLVAGIGPGFVRTATPFTLGYAAAGGMILAAGTGLVLAAADMLRGPTLLPYGGAFAEATTFAAIGALGGVIINLITSATRVESAA